MEESFAERLKKAIKFRGFTEYDVCNVSGLSPLTLKHYLSGRRTPSVANLTKLQKALDTDFEWLATGR
jgi:transcriptional regulator with XRE-family HTH domain